MYETLYHHAHVLSASAYPNGMVDSPPKNCNQECPHLVVVGRTPSNALKNEIVVCCIASAKSLRNLESSFASFTSNWFLCEADELCSKSFLWLPTSFVTWLSPFLFTTIREGSSITSLKAYYIHHYHHLFQHNHLCYLSAHLKLTI